MIVGMASDPDGAASIAWTDSSTLLTVAVKLLGRGQLQYRVSAYQGSQSSATSNVVNVKVR